MELSQRRQKLIGRLRSRKSREREGRVLVEGVRAVSTALEAGVRVDFVVTAPRLSTTEAGRQLEQALADGEVPGVDVHGVTDSELDELADTEHPQGVVLACHQPEATGPWLGKRLLVLDAVQDPGNVGTLVRSAVAFGFDGVACLDGTADPWGAKAVRASAGLVFRLPVFVCTVSELMQKLEERSLPLIAASADGMSVREWRAGSGATGVGPVSGAALVVGNEGAGVRPAIEETAVAKVGVEMVGPAESLNVGVAASILMQQLGEEGA